MTAGLLTGQRTDAWRVTFVFHELPERLTLTDVSTRLADLRALIVASFWVEYRRTSGPKSPFVSGPRPSLDEGLRVDRLSYNSPLQVVLEIAPYAATGLASLRGVVYVMSKWEDWRAKRAWTNYQVAAYALLTTNLPSKDNLSPEANAKSLRLLTEGEKEQAAKVLPLIHRVTVEDDKA